MSVTSKTVRRATVDDIDEIDKANRAMLPENYSTDFYKQFFSSNACCNFVVVDANGEFAGYILATAEIDAKKQLIGHIYSIAVYPKHQRKGFATLLLNSVEQDLKERFPAIKYISLNVRKSNKAATLLYCKHDYNRAKVEKAYYKNKVEDGLLMKKYL